MDLRENERLSLAAAVVADGLLIASSQQVSEYALRETAYLVRKMLANRPDLLERLVERKMAADPSWPRFHGPKADDHSAETGLLKKPGNASRR